MHLVHMCPLKQQPEAASSLWVQHTRPLAQVVYVGGQECVQHCNKCQPLTLDPVHNAQCLVLRERSHGVYIVCILAFHALGVRRSLQACHSVLMWAACSDWLCH
jgi:hypothetical protein